MLDIKVHFVCNGNVFRSRMAELYAESLNVKGITFSSSGVVSDAHYNTPEMSPLVTGLLAKNGLKSMDSPVRTQTTADLLANQDIIIFMNSDVRQNALHLFGFNEVKAKAWHVEDWSDTPVTAESLRSPAAARFAQKTLEHIKNSVDNLIRDITSCAWVDARSSDDQELGFSLPISWVNKHKDIWHRGVHIVITTPGGYVVEKRSAGIIFSPSLLDLGVGGGVDSGETPLAAAQREIKEELGIMVNRDQLHLLEITKWASYHPHYKRYSRVHLHTYHLNLDTEAGFNIQTSEVADVRVISLRQLHILLLARSLHGFGRLVSAYKYYNRIVRLVEADKMRTDQEQ